MPGFFAPHDEMSYVLRCYMYAEGRLQLISRALLVGHIILSSLPIVTRSSTVRTKLRFTGDLTIDAHPAWQLLCMAARLTTIANQITKHTPPNPSSSSTMASSPKASLAILDDYAGIAAKHFTHIPDLNIDSFPDTLNPTKPPDLDLLATRLKPYQIISSMRERTPFPADLQTQLPNLKLLLNSGARNASIDMPCASSHGIVVTGTKGDRPTDREALERLDELPPPAGHSTVVQHAWAQLLGLCSRIPQDDHALKSGAPGKWQSGLMVPLAGKKLGILGLGKLGVGMARVGVLAWGMEIVAWSENLTQEKADAAAEGAGLAKGCFRAVGKEELFREADVVSVHYVLSARSRGVVGAKELAGMKGGAVVVNTSRGPLIDEGALVEALREGRIGGACLDVFDEEPLPADSPWRSANEWAKSEVLLSPHMGYANTGTMNRWYQEQAENVERWMKGEEVLNRMN